MNLDNFLLENKDLTVKIRSDAQILKLFLLISNGWHLKKNNKKEFKPDCILELNNKKFNLKSNLFSRFKNKSHYDLVSILNEFLIFLSYFYCSKLNNYILIHCCGYQQNNQNYILFANHKVGKSEFCAKKLFDKSVLLADDLVLYNKKNAEFKSLGFSIRLRRPIKKHLIDIINKNNFISGKKYSYISSKSINIKKCGEIFHADNFFILSKLQKLKNILISDYFKLLNKNQINIYKF